MGQCKTCKLYDNCERVWKDPPGTETHTCCVGYTPIITNGNYIRAMTDEELAEYLIRDIEVEAIRRAGRFITDEEVTKGINDCIEWLKQEVKDG